MVYSGISSSIGGVKIGECAVTKGQPGGVGKKTTRADFGNGILIVFKGVISKEKPSDSCLAKIWAWLRGVVYVKVETEGKNKTKEVGWAELNRGSFFKRTSIQKGNSLDYTQALMGHLSKSKPATQQASKPPGADGKPTPPPAQAGTAAATSALTQTSTPQPTQQPKPNAQTLSEGAGKPEAAQALASDAASLVAAQASQTSAVQAPAQPVAIEAPTTTPEGAAQGGQTSVNQAPAEPTQAQPIVVPPKPAATDATTADPEGQAAAATVVPPKQEAASAPNAENLAKFNQSIETRKQERRDSVDIAGRRKSVDILVKPIEPATAKKTNKRRGSFGGQPKSPAVRNLSESFAAVTPGSMKPRAAAQGNTTKGPAPQPVAPSTETNPPATPSRRVEDANPLLLTPVNKPNMEQVKYDIDVSLLVKEEKWFRNIYADFKAVLSMPKSLEPQLSNSESTFKITYGYLEVRPKDLTKVSEDVALKKKGSNVDQQLYRAQYTMKAYKRAYGSILEREEIPEYLVHGFVDKKTWDALKAQGVDKTQETIVFMVTAQGGQLMDIQAQDILSRKPRNLEDPTPLRKQLQDHTN